METGGPLSRGLLMMADKVQYCWEIMQCDDEQLCPVRKNKLDQCWQFMKEHNQFQCQYGLCKDCIVYLCNNENTILTDWEIERIMIRRGFYQEGIRLYEPGPGEETVTAWK